MTNDSSRKYPDCGPGRECGVIDLLIQKPRPRGLPALLKNSQVGTDLEVATLARVMANPKVRA
jgi:hypothetical protein